MPDILAEPCDFAQILSRLAYTPRQRTNLFFGPTTVTTSSFISAITARVVAFRNRRRVANVRRQLGYREMLDLGIYRGHLDRVASAENEAI
jgi:hypothetical protein